MIILISIFSVGIILGWFFRRTNKIQAVSGKLTMASIAILLFLLGFGVGKNDDVRMHLDSLGLTAFLIALFSIGGSILFAWITWKAFYSKHER